MKVNSKGRFEVKYSFLKPMSQTFEVLTQCCDVTNPKLARNLIFLSPFTQNMQILAFFDQILTRIKRPS